MELVCGLCNNLLSLDVSCPSCGSPMEDNGLLQDYFDPYSPYQEQDSPENTDSERADCEHVISCPVCHYHQVLSVPRWPK